MSPTVPVPPLSPVVNAVAIPVVAAVPGELRLKAPPRFRASPAWASVTVSAVISWANKAGVVLVLLLPPVTIAVAAALPWWLPVRQPASKVMAAPAGDTMPPVIVPRASRIWLMGRLCVGRRRLPEVVVLMAHPFVVAVTIQSVVGGNGLIRRPVPPTSVPVARGVLTPPRVSRRVFPSSKAWPIVVPAVAPSASSVSTALLTVRLRRPTTCVGPGRPLLRQAVTTSLMGAGSVMAAAVSMSVCQPAGCRPPVLPERAVVEGVVWPLSPQLFRRFH